MNYRDTLTSIYTKYDPSKLDDIDSILKTYRGHEKVFIETLLEKYQEEDMVRKFAQREKTRPRPSHGEGIQYRSTRAAEREEPPKPTPAPAPPVPAADTTVAELRSILNDMTAIDISVLTERLVHSPPDSPNYSETLKHTLNFVQFFSQRAADFICLAEKYAVPSTAQLARPETENKSTSPVQLSPPRRARTDTPHVHRTQSSNERDPIVRPFAIPKYAPPSDEEEEEEAPATPLPTVVSIEPQANTGAPVIEQRLRDNASFSLGSGIYYENLKFDNCGDVELSAAVAGDPVLFRPHSAAEPLITVVGPHSNATFNNLVFVFGELTEFEEDGEGFRYDPHIPTVPLVSIVSGATATFNGCHFYKGGAAGVLASDEGTRVEMNYCFLAKCAFGAVFARHYSTVSLHHCRLKYCEAGARISTHSTMHFTETSVEKSGVDGVVVHEGGTVALHRCSVSQNGGNGLLISSGASAVVSECTVSENALYGIQRTSGSNVRLLHSSIQNNGLSSVSEGSVNL